MKKHIALYAIVAAALIAAPGALQAQPATTPPAKADAATPAKKKKNASVSGKVTAVDTKAMTVTVKDETYNVTSTTKILKNEKPGTLTEINVGDMVRIIYKKDDAGKLNATTIHGGAMTANDKKKTE